MRAVAGRPKTIMSWVAQIIAGGILGMSAIMKLTSSPDAVALFTSLGVEPWGRWAVGLIETLGVGLLLMPRTAFLGGVLGAFLMVGAIGTHLLSLGIVFNGDASLFLMAIVVLVASVTVAALRRPAPDHEPPL